MVASHGTSTCLISDRFVRQPPWTAELALDDVERDALACHLDRVSMAQLMRRKPPAHAGSVSEPVQVSSHG
jgi:hypothetical protein